MEHLSQRSGPWRQMNDFYLEREIIKYSVRCPHFSLKLQIGAKFTSDTSPRVPWFQTYYREILFFFSSRLYSIKDIRAQTRKCSDSRCLNSDFQVVRVKCWLWCNQFKKNKLFFFHFIFLILYFADGPLRVIDNRRLSTVSLCFFVP